MRKDILSAAALLLAITALLVALPACASGSSASSKTQTQTETTYHTLALVDAKTGQVDNYLPGPDGVTSVVSDRKGGWYVGGRFARIGNVLRRGVVHLESDGTIDPTFVPDLPRDMAISPILFNAGAVFVGDFGNKGVFALDAKSGKRLWHTPTGRDGGNVIELVLGNEVLYVGGGFTHIGGTARNGIAALNPINGKVTSWRVRLWNSVGYRGMGGADAIGVAGRIVYIAGLFDKIGGVKRVGMAAVSSRTGRPNAWVPEYKGTARSLESIDSILVTHGQVLAGSIDGGFAAFDARSGRVLSWPKRLKGGALALASSGNTVYLGGTTDNGFTRAGGKPANNLVSVILPKGRFTNWRPDLGRCTTVDAIAVYGTKVLVAGWFSPSRCSS